MLGMGKELTEFVDFVTCWLQMLQLVLADAVVVGTRCFLGDAMEFDRLRQVVHVVTMGYVAILLTFVVPLEPLLLLKLVLDLVF